MRRIVWAWLLGWPLISHWIVLKRIEDRAWQLHEALVGLERACARQGMEIAEQQWARDVANGFDIDFGPDTDASRLQRLIRR